MGTEQSTESHSNRQRGIPAYSRHTGKNIGSHTHYKGASIGHPSSSLIGRTRVTKVSKSCRHNLSCSRYTGLRALQMKHVMMWIVCHCTVIVMRIWLCSKRTALCQFISLKQRSRNILQIKLSVQIIQLGSRMMYAYLAGCLFSATHNPLCSINHFVMWSKTRLFSYSITVSIVRK